MKKIHILLMTAVLMITLTVTASAAQYPRVYDEADLLTDTEERSLIAVLDKLSTSWQTDIVIAAVRSTGMKSPMAYADDFFDYNGYGFGASRDGILLLISMEERDWWISTSGYAISAFTDAGIEYIGEQILPYLSAGEYAGAFGEYAALCDEFLRMAESGEPFDVYNLPKVPFDGGTSLVIALVAGLIIALIYTGVLKSQLHTVHRQAAASAYVKDGSMQVHNARDLFLYRNVRRTERQSSSSGGSSTHRSSSGRSHGGGGGRF